MIPEPIVSSGEALIRDAVESAEDFSQWAALAVTLKPPIRVDHINPEQTVSDLRNVLVASGKLYDRGIPVRLAYDKVQAATVAEVMTPDSLVLMAHQVGRPVIFNTTPCGKTIQRDARLPTSAAKMYLAWRGEWELPILNGIASAPLLREDGMVVTSAGYDRDSGMWLEDVPGLEGLAERPTRADASGALMRLRLAFCTFCFADAEMVVPAGSGAAVVDTNKPPGHDESAFLVALLTAVCRPSLNLAPGTLISAPSMSGAGAGKGLLARCISIIAYGREPHAVTRGGTSDELEKRVAAELMNASPVLFLDNVNDTALRSELLANVMTERPARVRVLGLSKMVDLNASALVLLTGNGLSVSEDLARRFISLELDPRTEHPEARSFARDVRVDVRSCRAEMLTDLLMIWRWGRQEVGLEKGRPLGSFDQWCRWVRDPLLTLGCCDPAIRVGDAKHKDALRQWIAEVFTCWWDRHADNAVALRDLHPDVLQALDRQQRGGRQHQASLLTGLVGTRLSGFVLARKHPAGKWGTSKYALAKTPRQKSIGTIGGIGTIGCWCLLVPGIRHRCPLCPLCPLCLSNPAAASSWGRPSRRKTRSSWTSAPPSLSTKAGCRVQRRRSWPCRSSWRSSPGGRDCGFRAPPGHWQNCRQFPANSGIAGVAVVVRHLQPDYSEQRVHG